MDETGKEVSKPVQRLCSEIQLFDLCGLNECKNREGRFCTNREILDRFEGIAEDDARCLVHETYVDEDDDESGYGDFFTDDACEGEGDDCEEE